MRTTNLCLGLLFLMISTGGCKPIRNQDAATLKDVQAGQETSSKSLMDDPEMRKRDVVLIYYANDTYAPTGDDPAYQNFQHIVTSLRSGAARQDLTEPQRRSLALRADRYESDWNNFRKVTGSDVNLLINSLCIKNPRFKAGLIVFRNSGSDALSDESYDRELPFTYCRPGDSARVGRMKIPRFNNMIFDAQPLAHPHVFQRAIEEVIAHFPTGVSRYALITKSHGSKNLAIAPFVGRDVRQLSADQIVDAAVESMTPASATLDGKESTPILDDQKESTPILGDQKESTPILGDQKESTPILGDEKESLPILDAPDGQPDGVTKDQFMAALFKYGGGNPKLGAYYSLVFMESCKSDLKLATDGWVQRLLKEKDSYRGLEMENVGLLYTADERGLGYDTINYRDLFVGIKYAKYNDLQDALRAYLDGIAKQ